MNLGQRQPPGALLWDIDGAFTSIVERDIDAEGDAIRELDAAGPRAERRIRAREAPARPPD
jgi:hypothetical protein